jgi:hypothetical protein
MPDERGDIEKSVAASAQVKPMTRLRNHITLNLMAEGEGPNSCVICAETLMSNLRVQNFRPKEGR